MKKPLRLSDDFMKSLNKQQSHRIISIEDRIEQSWKAIDIMLSLNVINGISGSAPPPPMSQKSKQILQDMDASAKHLAEALGAGKAGAMSQFDIDRNNIWDAVRRNGIATVLSFIDVQLVTNIEKFFAGLVVSYITMFNHGQRTALPADKIFANKTDLKELHKRFYDLRNKWYAHTELEEGRHILKYRVDEEGKITIYKMGEQITPEYHLSESFNLFKCTGQVSLFIDKDLDEKISALMETLTVTQKDILVHHWNHENTLKKFDGHESRI
ncbi:hypothetical protein [Azospirillum sp.]|uniref:hypothetical protein n=1 Tax=Azospirillum sp. TaxID=34012 RepID=UPI002D4B36F8|nr:hypothetical protein [Azospirillum sp.]HYD70562.1 hypothetical protein [Azospirillum sp.]